MRFYITNVFAEGSWVKYRYLILMAALLTACTEPTSFHTTGGEALPGTESNYSLIGGAFSISPDGHWLFSTNYDPAIHEPTPAAAIDHAYLLDLQTNRKSAIEFGDSARALLKREGVVAESGCWQGGLLYLRTAFRKSIRIDAAAAPLRWQAGDRPPCEADDRSPDNLIDIRRDGEHVAVIHRPGGRILATYSPLPLIGTKVQIDNVITSHDGRFVSYRVTRPLGSFTGNSAAWLVDLKDNHASPILLAGTSGTIRFSPANDAVLVQTRDRNAGERRWIIARWRL